MSCAIYRDSCYTCQYTNLNRVGDFTLGDFWGAEGLNLPFSVNNGCSLVLVNNEKAANWLETLDLNQKQVPVYLASKYNKQLSEPSISLSNRAELLREYREESASVIQKKFKTRNRKNRLKARIKYWVPTWVRNMLLQIKYHRNGKENYE